MKTWPAALVLAFAWPARADDPACHGLHGVWAPLPDACMETIDTDRPHQTDTPHVVPAGHAQFESAVVAVQTGGTLTGSDRTTHVAMLENAYKFGLLSRVDLQLIFKHADYVPDTARFIAPGPLEARVKINIVEERGAVPAVTLVPTIFVPFASSQALRGGLLLFWGWELPGGFELEMNAGALFGATPKPPAVLVLAAAITHPFLGPVKTFVDIYATGWDIQMGSGFLMPIGRDVQIDAGAYFGLNGEVYGVTPFIGFSVRR